MQSDGSVEPLNLRNLDRDQLASAVARFGVGADVAGRIFARVHRDGAAGFPPGSRGEPASSARRGPSREGLGYRAVHRSEAAIPRDRSATLPGFPWGSVRGLSNAAAAALDAACEWPDLEVLDRRRSEDGFLKYLLKLPDGREIETVRIPLPAPEAARALKERRRAGQAAPLEALPTAKYTVCLSSQVGCALACDFCATGRLGGIRSLKTWEILAQLRIVAREAEHPVRGAVFMGMGEPLLNYDNVIRAARIMSDPAGPAIGAKAISISTAGVLPAIRRFTAEGHHYRLILSLGAPTSDERRRLMPIEDRWPLAEVMAAMRDHAAARGQRVTLAYVVLGGVNSTPAHARALGALIGDLRVKLNLIDVSDDSGRYRRATPEELSAFRDALDALGVPVVRRYSGGSDIAAACGTLAATRRGGQLAVVG